MKTLDYTWFLSGINMEDSRKRAETYLRECLFGYEPPYCLSCNSMNIVSEDFIREWKDVIEWDVVTKDFIKQTRGEKFYKEIFGDKK